MREPLHRRSVEGSRRRIVPGLLLAAAAVLGPATSLLTQESLPADETIERTVDEVFAEPAFADGLASSHGGFAELLSELSNLFWLWADKLLRFLDDLRLESPLLFWMFFIGLFVVLVLLLLHIGWSISLAFRRAPTGGSDGAHEGHAERARRFRDLRQSARERAAAGELREATHLLLLALVALVEERKLLRVAHAWTHREIISRLRPRGEPPGAPGSAALDEFQSRVERVWYGGAAIGAEEFARLDSVLDTVAPALAAAEGASAARRPHGGVVQ